MKHFILFIIALLSTFLLSAQTESEPNNSFNTANEIAFGDTVTAFIEENYDDDYFKFTAPESGMVKVEIFNKVDELNLETEIRKSDNTLIVKEDNGDFGFGYTLWGSTCFIGEHFIKIENSNSQFNENISYSFKVSFIPFSEVDKCECENETLSQACSIDIGLEIEAGIAPYFESTSNTTVKDHDFYKFEITKPSLIRIDVTEVPDNIDLDTWIYNPSKDEIWYDSSPDNGESYTIWFSSCDIGEHYLYLRDDQFGSNVGPQFNPEVQYKFRIDTFHFSGIDKYECNNSINNASKIGLCDTVNALFNPWFKWDDGNNTLTKDEDYYEIELEADKEVNVQITSIADNIELCVGIYNESQNQIKTYSKNEGQPLNVNYLPPYSGIYYLKVENCNSGFDPEMQYQMTIGCNLVNSNSDLESVDDISTYPNPFEDYLTIESEALLNQDIEIEIFDVTGKRVYFENARLVENYKISTIDIPSGLLILNLKSKDNIYTLKIYKQ